MHLSIGKAEDALELYESALTLDRNCYAAWLGKGTALKILKRYEEALDCYEQDLTLNRDSIMAECLAGNLRAELKNRKT